MAQITINEISQNYTFNTGSSNFATVALPITACWGPAFSDPKTLGASLNDVLENTTWQRFSSNREGFDLFASTFRGPSANYRAAKDYSFHMAQTLLASGYDVLVCRLCPGAHAQGKFTSTKPEGGELSVIAKYPGTFGNSLMCTLRFIPTTIDSKTKKMRGYWNVITYVVDASGVKTALENIVFTFDMANSTDSILHISEVESNFITFKVNGKFTDDTDTEFAVTANSTASVATLSGGTDRVVDADGSITKQETLDLANTRYFGTTTPSGTCKYIDVLSTAFDAKNSDKETIYYKEWLYTNAIYVYDLLKDKLTYSPNRVISPGWDDQDIVELGGSFDEGDHNRLDKISPIHLKLMDVAYYSRCATALLDVPKSLIRSAVYNSSPDPASEGYAQMLARYIPNNAVLDVNGSLYPTHSGLFAPWGQYTYVGTSRQNTASPSFLALLIQLAMLKNQSIQYEWALPTNRKHNVKVGKLAYTIPKKVLDEWQSLDGVGVNAITVLPDLGTTLWGNSTLYEVPPATYQALANLSTRYLINAVEDIVYRVGVSITFQYNNDQAYNKFYAGVTPTLDTMKNVGAITGYKVRMAADIDGLDSVNANTIIGKIYLTINGVVNDIVVDLIALPPNVDLNQFE